MRVTCPACQAPFRVPDEPADAPPRCPNCEAEYVPPRVPWWNPAAEPDPIPAPRSRALTIAGWLHFLPAAGGFCVAFAAADVVARFGAEPGFGYAGVAVGLVLAVAWLLSGIGVLMRAGFARWTALGLSALWAVGGLMGAGTNPVGAAVTLLAVGFVWAAVITCWNEFG
ncbi:MAG: hypothetical protein C0501_10330 [Isosphaera sp.]|nr:hypothetical protein [Isosphaera sp.]